jgi:hypothetical protein
MRWDGEGTQNERPMKRKPILPEPSDDVSPALNGEAMGEPTAMNERDPEEGSELDDPSDLESYELIDIDEKHWEVFIADEDDTNSAPDYGDFWMPD